MHPPILRSPRLLLRPLMPAEAPLLIRYKLENRAHLALWEPERDADYYTLEMTRRRLRERQAAFRQGTALHLALLTPDEDEVMGQCDFTQIVRGPFQACYLGFAIAARHQGRGLMYEALSLAIPYVFDELGLHRIMAGYMPDNARSERLLTRLGFQREGYARAYLKIAGRWQDHVLTALINPRD